MTFHLFKQRVLGEIDVDRTGIDRHLAPAATEQAVQRFAGSTCLRIPESDIDRGEGERGQAARASEVAVGPEPLPDPLVVSRILPDQQGKQVVVDQRACGQGADASCHCPAGADNSGLCFQCDEDQLPMRERQRGRGKGLAQRDAEDPGRDRCDVHGVLSSAARQVPTVPQIVGLR
jgi:hypothetical protein